ncbi:MAG: heavy metal-associated domain-containing protein [Spirosomataceae bacterium]
MKNLTCEGNAATLKTKLLNLTGVLSVEVKPETGLVWVMHTNSISRKGLAQVLHKLGYPETAP